MTAQTSPAFRSRVLALLTAGEPPLSAREVYGRVGHGSPITTRHALAELAEAGAVRRDRRPYRAHFVWVYTLAPERAR